MNGEKWCAEFGEKRGNEGLDGGFMSELNYQHKIKKNTVKHKRTLIDSNINFFWGGGYRE
jgi:hypothetical protein